MKSGVSTSILFFKEFLPTQVPEKNVRERNQVSCGRGGGVAKYDVKCCLKADENLYTILFLQDSMTSPDLT